MNSGEALELLKSLIRVPSFSKEEDKSAAIIQQALETRGVQVHRTKNNVWACNKYFSPSKPTILLNSHHDTVKPNAGWTRNPFDPAEEDGRLYGLGSNDAGACVVALTAAFLHFYERQDLKYNLILALTAEEEISGANGIASLLPELPPVGFAIVGEPTGMQLAIAEKGLMVLDCVSHGKAGHAAREEGENAIYAALKDIAWFSSFQFPKTSALLGPVKMNVTMIHAGTQHNVIPDRCEFVVDVRTTDAYTNEETLGIIRTHVSCEVTPRSIRLKPSAINKSHPLVRAGEKIGLTTYGSPTLSDQALLNVPSVKTGPGASSRSHTAEEFVYTEELKQGIDTYILLLEGVV